MSLQLTNNHPSGLVLTDAVHKISQAAFSLPDRLHVVVSLHKDLAASQDGSPEILPRREYSMSGFDPATSTNTHTQAYDWLKTLPEFTGAADV